MSDDRREFLLSALRGASLRAKLYAVDIDTIGVALKAGMVTPVEAIAWAKEVGIIEWLGRIPDDPEEIAAA